MPELPDIVVYLESLERYVLGKRLEKIRIGNPFLLRSVRPKPDEAEDRKVIGTRRLGKRIVLALEGEFFLVLHLMIAGTVRWREQPPKLSRKLGIAAFDFENGSILLTEASSKKRASLHVVQGEAALDQHDPGGIQVLDCDLPTFVESLTRHSHTLKRALTDPRIFSGIGNAYSDEILHRARLSPFKLTGKLSEDECQRLFEASRETLTLWTARLRDEVGDGFPDKVTAFREGMAVHGRYRKPCPDCGADVQRIAYSSNEANYCARCQTGGKILADRALSRLLKKDWPRTLEELEALRATDPPGPAS